MQDPFEKIHHIRTAIENFFETPLPQKTWHPPHLEKPQGYIDHTFLKPTCTHQDIEQLCKEALKYKFYGVCVPPRFVSFARKHLEPYDTKIVTVIGFPLGYQKSNIKRLEAIKALENGASELDMVLPLGALQEGRWAVVRKDIQFVTQSVGKIPVKVILETGYLTVEQIAAGCFLSLLAGASYVKTSTGFGPRGASLEDIELMHACVGKQMGIKASGGIKTFKQLNAMIEKGACRIGTSSGVSIVQENQS